MDALHNVNDREMSTLHACILDQEEVIQRLQAASDESNNRGDAAGGLHIPTPAFLDLRTFCGNCSIRRQGRQQGEVAR